jgi:hypothetical protein
MASGAGRASPPVIRAAPPLLLISDAEGSRSLHAATGRVRWRQRHARNERATLTEAGVLITSRERVRLLPAGDPEAAWSRRLPDPAVGRGTVIADTLVVGDRSGTVHGLRLHDGGIRRSTSLRIGPVSWVTASSMEGGDRDRPRPRGRRRGLVPLRDRRGHGGTPARTGRARPGRSSAGQRRRRGPADRGGSSARAARAAGGLPPARRPHHVAPQRGPAHVRHAPCRWTAAHDQPRPHRSRSE